jgi:hypothetical protein
MTGKLTKVRHTDDQQTRIRTDVTLIVVVCATQKLGHPRRGWGGLLCLHCRLVETSRDYSHLLLPVNISCFNLKSLSDNDGHQPLSLISTLTLKGDQHGAWKLPSLRLKLQSSRASEHEFHLPTRTLYTTIWHVSLDEREIRLVRGCNFAKDLRTCHLHSPVLLLGLQGKLWRLEPAIP